MSVLRLFRFRPTRAEFDVSLRSVFVPDVLGQPGGRWASWADLEAATGADRRAASQTRHAEMLESWVVERFEVVPAIPIIREVVPQPA
jgi:hypothetical protein